MRNKNQNNLCDVMCDLQTLQFANCYIFSDSFFPWSVKYFMHVRKTFIKRHSVIQRRSRPKLFRACELL